MKRVSKCVACLLALSFMFAAVPNNANAGYEQDWRDVEEDQDEVDALMTGALVLAGAALVIAVIWYVKRDEQAASTSVDMQYLMAAAKTEPTGLYPVFDITVSRRDNDKPAFMAGIGRSF